MLLRLFIAAALTLSAQGPKDGPFPGHKVVGNLYYVGSQQYSSYLISTPQGHILINASFPETVPLIKASIESLGFKFQDVKILLTSHAHGDHVAGTAKLREFTAARIYVMDGDQGIVESGGQGDFQYNSKWEPVKVDKVLHHGDKVELGGSTLVAQLTPGHTRGCTTWTMVVKDGAQTYNVVIVGSPNVNPGYKLVGNAKYPQIAEDYARSFKLWKSLPCDVFLGAHGNYYGMAEKYDRLKAKPTENPFIDPEGYRKYIENREQAYLKELEKQKQAAGK